MRKNNIIFKDSRKGYLSQDYISFLNIFGDWIEFRTFVRIPPNSDLKIRLERWRITVSATNITRLDLHECSSVICSYLNIDFLLSKQLKIFLFDLTFYSLNTLVCMICVVVFISKKWYQIWNPIANTIVVLLLYNHPTYYKWSSKKLPTVLFKLSRRAHLVSDCRF